MGLGGRAQGSQPLMVGRTRGACGLGEGGMARGPAGQQEQWLALALALVPREWQPKRGHLFSGSGRAMPALEPGFPPSPHTCCTRLAFTFKITRRFPISGIPEQTPELGVGAVAAHGAGHGHREHPSVCQLQQAEHHPWGTCAFGERGLHQPWDSGICGRPQARGSCSPCF